MAMVDPNGRAVNCQRNAELNGVAGWMSGGEGCAPFAGEKFDYIITNPPIRAGKKVVLTWWIRLMLTWRKAALPGGDPTQQGAASLA